MAHTLARRVGSRRPATSFATLSQLPWADDPAASIRQAIGILRAFTGGLRAVTSWLSALDESGIQHVVDRSVERPSHIKWYLAGTSEYRVWLHEYKVEALARAVGSFASSIHNHRYSFASLVLSGQLQAEIYAVERNHPSLLSQRVLGVGDTHLLAADDVHSAYALLPGTMTLVIEGPKARDFSVVYSLNGEAPRVVHDLESRLALLTQGQS